MISKKCSYALRAILYLAVNSSGEEKIGLNAIADSLKIPAPYLGKILQELVPREIISSVKGPNGGFYLTAKNLQTPLIKVVDAVDGLVYFENCGLGLEDCSEEHPCPIHDDFKKSRDYLLSVFESKSIEDLAKETKANDLILVR